MPPAVAVVIPTYERPQLVVRTLQALARVCPAPVEVVVVDDGSSAQHSAAIEGAVSTIAGARLLRQPNRGPAAARNLGVAATSAPFVAFLDDDCAPDEDWLARLTAPFAAAGDDLAAVGGCVMPAEPTNWVMRFCAATEYSSGLQPVFENAATANACYRRSVLEELGGFDIGFRHPGGDDPDLSARARAAGYRLEFAANAIVHHSELETYGDFVLHMFRRGLGEARYAKKHGRRARATARAVLFPLYLARTGVGCWRRTAGKGGDAKRLMWVGLELVGRVAFLAGSVQGLVASR